MTTNLFPLTVLPKEKSTTTVVFFLGGCTYTEISAIRWMGKHLRGTWVHCRFRTEKITEPCIRTKVRDCYDWYRERKFFNRCVDTRELHEGASAIRLD
jgi:hypothetical protein